jgi:ribosome-binding protein aMBF1 (putative translation factor)
VRSRLGDPRSMLRVGEALRAGGVSMILLVSSYERTETDRKEPESLERGRRLSRALATARQAAGKTQEELARASGVSVDEIRSIEQARVRNPGFFTVADVARASRADLRQLDDESRASEGRGAL